MNLSDIYKSDPQNLARLLDAEKDERKLFHTSDLGGILQHQLQADLRQELVEAFPDHAEVITRKLRGSEIATYADILHHASPPAEVLDLVKHFAKKHYGQQETALPQRVAAVLYYATIATALIRNLPRLSSLDSKAINEGFQWALKETWLDERTRSLIRGGKEQLAGALAQAPSSPNPTNL